MRLSDEQWSFLQDVALLIVFAKINGLKLTGKDLLRKKGCPDYSETSNHSRGLAVDLALFMNGTYRKDTDAYRKLGNFWESLNDLNRWGGHFLNKDGRPDGNHFERVPEGWR